MKLTCTISIVILFYTNTWAQSSYLTDNYYDRVADNSLWYMHSPQTSRDTLNCFVNELKSNCLPAAIRMGDTRNPDYLDARQVASRFYHCCKEIILISQRIQPELAIPEKAKENYVKGVTLMEDDTTKTGKNIELGIVKLHNANIIAPWWNIVYKKLGVAFELKGDNDLAIIYFQLYLLTHTSSEEARKVQNEIYRCEEMLEMNKK